MQDYFVKKDGIDKLFSFLQAQYVLYVINRKGENLFWKTFSPEKINEVIINEYRPTEPLKGFIFKSKEKILNNFGDIEEEKRPCAVIGAKACDLHSLKVLDYVFMEGDFKDPFYIKARQQNLIVSSDCTSFKDVCFCLGIGVEPFPKEMFDLNFSELEDGYIITVGSEKGKDVLEKIDLSVSKVTDRQREKVQKNKQDFLNKLQASIDSTKLPSAESFKDAVRSNFKSEVWNEFADKCVECGGCNTICPTCHCFLLVDQGAEDKYQRLKIWDSCLLKRFAKVAGGANPRKHLNERLRNRFIKKFDFFPEILELYACTGCGRCIETCPGDIDLREVLKSLATRNQKLETSNQ